jgi:hypothetical protein
MTSVLKKIRTRGYWQVLIRPVKYKADRIPFTSLMPLIHKTSVQLRGAWDFPHIDTHNPIHKGVSWVAQECDWGHFLESWRFYQSGQFFHSSGIWQDWRDQSDICPADKDWEYGTLLGVGDTVSHFSEIFEFAARLAFTEAGDDLIHIEVKLSGLMNRLLWNDDPQRMGFVHRYKTSINEFPSALDVSRTELIANPHELAIKQAQLLFTRFDWEPSLAHLKTFQPNVSR